MQGSHTCTAVEKTAADKRLLLLTQETYKRLLLLDWTFDPL